MVLKNGEKKMQIPIFKPQTEWVYPDEFPDLSKYDEIAIDLETKDPDLKTKGTAATRGIGDVVGIAVAVSNWSGYYPIAHENGPNLERKKVLGWFQDVLKTSADKIFHNAMYDVIWLRRLGLTVHGTIIDTMIMTSIVDENRFRYDLNSVSFDFTGLRKNEATLQQAAKDWGIDPKAEMYKLPAMYVGEYAEKDAEITLELWQELKKEIAGQDLSSIVELETKVLPVLVDMKWKGVRIDEDHVEVLENKFKKTIDSNLQKVKEAVGFHPEIWAAANIAKVCDSLGIRDYERTEKTKKPSFTKNYLANHPNKILRSIAHARQLDKLRNTFLESIKNYVHKGRIYADIHQLKGDQGGTVTGRLSYSHPNLQQLPNYSNVGMGIRSIFIPEQGCKWGCFDYSQQEPRLVLHFASITPGMIGIGDMLERYRSDKTPDFHSEIADLTGLDRRQAKAISLGLFYGMGKAKLQAQLGINDDKKAQDILRSYDHKVPFVKKLIKQVMNRAQDRGRVRTLLGRSCRFNLWEPAQFGVHKPLPHNEAYTEYGPQIRRAFTYKALNKLIQGSAADMTKQAMVNLHSENIIPEVQLHDELDISIEDDNKKKKIIEIMENAVKLEVPNKVDCETGENWGSIEGEDDMDKTFF